MSPTVKHLNFIQTLTNLIVVAMENARMAKQELQQERDKRELELAAEMQNMLVPAQLPNNEWMSAAAWYKPHRQVGGDYYDLIPNGKDRYMMAMADVSGKGMAAALLMSNFQASLRALIQYRDDDLPALVRELNDKVFASARGERFITLFLADIDLVGRRIRYVNAGHNPAMYLTQGKVDELREGTIPLGMLPMLPKLDSGQVEIRSGDTLLAYTDGLVEQEDSHGMAFETEPIERLLRDMAPAGCAALNSAMISAYEAHRGDVPPLDDIALLTCRFS
jgi:sigma-B regulation protein RsbU (phosphoserine phosphatase)